jgi:hypothetical protein
MFMFRKTHIVLLILFGLFACEPEISEFKPQPGNADFSVFVSLGCNLVAGFTNNELYRSGQIVSIPNIISRQLLHVGGGEFKQPLMKDELGFGRRLNLVFAEDCHNEMVLMTAPATGIPDEGNLQNIYSEEGPFHNLGVPGAKIHHITGKNIQNPIFTRYFTRMAASSGKNLIDEAAALNPTFFMLWTGIAEFIDYIMQGGTMAQIIEPEEFENHLVNILDKLTTNASGGVIANIPDLKAFPFLSAIETEGLWVVDFQNTSGKRLIREDELVLISISEQVKCESLGSENNPIPENRYLNQEQVQLINERIEEFNTIIRQKSQDYNIAFVDAFILFDRLRFGRVYEGIPFNNTFITGGMFSMDGYTLTRRGNAIVANAFIDAINRKYRSTIPRVSITQFQGIEYP